jgi:hypothetical protein
VSAVNSQYNDLGPGVSRDGLSLYFASDRPAPDGTPAAYHGDQDIYVAQRSSTDADWGVPHIVTAVSSPSRENAISFSRDGHWMFFNSNRPGSLGEVDIWASYRQHVHDDFDWQTPFDLGAGVNSGLTATGKPSRFNAGASYFENEDGAAPLLFFGRGVSFATMGTTTDIFVAELQTDGTFGNAHPVASLNSDTGDQRPSIRYDGLEIIFYSNRLPTHGRQDFWVATRNDTHSDWNQPVNLGDVVNSTSAEFNPYLSGDGQTLYFTSDRPSDCAAASTPFNIYATSRSRHAGAAG